MSEGIEFWKESRNFERWLIELALKKCNGNQTQAAKFLNLPRSTFIMRLKALEEDQPSEAKIRELTAQLDAAEQEYKKADEIRIAMEARMMFIEGELQKEKAKSMAHTPNADEFIRAAGWESLLG